MLVYKCRPKQRSTFSGDRRSWKELKPFGEWLDRQRKQFNNPLPSGPAVRKAGQEAKDSGRESRA